MGSSKTGLVNLNSLKTDHHRFFALKTLGRHSFEGLGALSTKVRGNFGSYL